MIPNYLAGNLLKLPNYGYKNMPEMNDLIKTIRTTLFVPIHPAGWPFIVGAALITILLSLLWEGFGLIGLVITLWCIYFFRDPVRTVPDREGLIVSPADGLVQMITSAPLPAEIEIDTQGDPLFSAKELTRISIFLNVFDVHVNRTPVSGTVSQVIYTPGKFINASLDKASEDNERSTAVIKIKDHDSSIAFVQIAGLVARRIINTLSDGQKVETGEKYGIIRFGSRVDIYLPPKVNPMVIEGQRVIGGETIIADFKSREKTRSGQKR